jgi:hypothetical protein
LSEAMDPIGLSLFGFLGRILFRVTMQTHGEWCRILVLDTLHEWCIWMKRTCFVPPHPFPGVFLKSRRANEFRCIDDPVIFAVAFRVCIF